MTIQKRGNGVCTRIMEDLTRSMESVYILYVFVLIENLAYFQIGVLPYRQGNKL